MVPFEGVKLDNHLWNTLSVNIYIFGKSNYGSDAPRYEKLKNDKL